MIKIIRFFVGGLIVMLVSLTGYRIYQVSPREFFPDSLTFAYVNEDVKSKDIDEVLKFLENQGYNLDEKKIKKFQKKIDGIYLFETASFFDDEKEPVLLLDVGLNFLIYYFKIKEYFEFTGKDYVLKPEYMKNMNFEKLGIDELYMRPYRGNYLFSGDPGRIDEVISERTAMSEDGKDFLDSKEYGNLGIMFFNLKKENAYGLNNLSVVLDYKKEGLDIFSIVSFKELELETPGDGYRADLVRYIGENTLYIRIKDYVKAYDVSRRYIRKDRKIEFLVGFWQNILGVDLIRMLDDIDQESVYDFEKKSGIIRFKNRDRINKVVEWTSYRDNIGFEAGLELEGNYLYIGDKRLIPNREDAVKLKYNQILYYSRKFDGKEIKIQAFNHQRAARVQARLNDKALSDIIEKIEKTRDEIERRDEQ